MLFERYAVRFLRAELGCGMLGTAGVDARAMALEKAICLWHEALLCKHIVHGLFLCLLISARLEAA